MYVYSIYIYIYIYPISAILKYSEVSRAYLHFLIFLCLDCSNLAMICRILFEKSALGDRFYFKLRSFG